jgi:hypothetical protein
MKKTTVFEYELSGSACSWGVEVSISRHQRSGLWTLYFNYTDPEARAVEKHQAETQEDFLSIAEERNMDIDSFCDALISSKDPELIALGNQIVKEQDVPR